MITRDKDHIYRNEKGEIYISMTQHLQIAGYVDYSMVPFEVLETARIRGGHVHDANYLLINDDLDLSEPLDKTYAGYVNAFMRFCEETQIKPWAGEELVWSDELRTAGGFDLVGSIGFDKHATGHVFEAKTTAVYYEHTTALQVAGYIHMWNKTRKKKLFKGWGLHLRKNGTYRLHEVDIKKYDPWFQAMVYSNWCAVNDGLMTVGVKGSEEITALCNLITGR